MDDFVTDEIPENKLLALELSMRSLVNNANFGKLGALFSFMTYKSDITSVSETWITPLSSSPFINLSSYKFVHHSRLHSNGGEVPLYVNDTNKFHVLTELTTMPEKLFELKNESVICETIYRSSSHDTGSNQIFLTTQKKLLNLHRITTNALCLVILIITSFNMMTKW